MPTAPAPSSHAPAILARGLARSFGDRSILSGIELEAAPGEAIALLGPNGSGKTTLLRILATLLLPSAGDAWIGGHSVSADPGAVRRQIAWVPASEQGFLARLKGRENLRYFAALSGLADDRELARRISPWMALPPFEEALATPFNRCSTGMRQLLRMARALIARPRVLLLDEPTRSLDPETAAKARAILREACGSASRVALVLATHSEEEAAFFSARAIRLAGASGAARGSE